MLLKKFAFVVWVIGPREQGFLRTDCLGVMTMESSVLLLGVVAVDVGTISC